MDLSIANAESPSVSESPSSSLKSSTETDPAPLDVLTDDSTFYGVAAELAKLREAVGPRFAQVMNKITSDVADSLNARGLEQPPGLIAEGEPGEIRRSEPRGFRYRQLEDEKAFRLLVLYPGDRLQPLSGTIEHHLVRQKGAIPGSYYFEGSYDAISYAWNSDARPCSICVDGHQAMITRSLYNALIRFRQPHRPRRIWADGLCINQEDKKERCAQVALMPMIYTYASNVLVYLGEQNHGSELLPQFIETVVRLNTHLLHEARLELREPTTIGLPSKDDPSWGAILTFFCRPWFSRIWIIQEVILARNALFYCGDWELKLWQIAEMGERFENCCRIVSLATWSSNFIRARRGAMSIALMRGFQHTRSTVAAKISMLREDITLPSPAFKRSSNLAQDIEAKRNSVIQSYKQHPELLPVFERMALAFDCIKWPTTPILKLLGVFSQHEASLPQDRLFALVGLAGDVDLKDFPPDYEESESETNARFSRVLVEKGQGMDVLYHATNHYWEFHPGFCPSWSPFWSIKQSLNHVHWLMLGWAYSSHSGGFDGRPSSREFVSLVEGRPSLLKVQGSRLGCLQSADSIAKLLVGDVKEGVFLTKAKQYFEHVSRLMNGPRYFTGESWVEVQCRTLTADRLERRGKSPSEIIEDFLATKNKIRAAAVSGQRTELLGTDWASEWFGLVPYYAACKTSEGFAGLVPSATSAGDEIVMIHGSDLPFVLRPILGMHGYYHFIGGCYMHGLMKGEAWKHVGEPKETLLL